MKKEITFITGNQGKADYLAKYLGYPVRHEKHDLDEIQSLDLKEIVEHKVRQAYEKVKGPVLVEDVSLEFEALNGLPGPFIRFFVDRVPFETICRMIDGQSRNAVGRCVFGYFDGQEAKFFEGKIEGLIAETPAPESGLGFGFDRIFIPEEYTVRRSELSEEDYQKNYMTMRPLAELKSFFERLKGSFCCISLK